MVDVCLCLPLSFALVTDKMYQRKEPVISSVHSKVKGMAEVTEEVVGGVRRSVQKVLDTADYTLPLQVSAHPFLPGSGLGLGHRPQGPALSPPGLRGSLWKMLALFKKLCENPNRENLKNCQSGPDLAVLAGPKIAVCPGAIQHGSVSSHSR